MSSWTRWSGFQGLCYRFIGVSASGVLLTLEWRCGSGSHWSDVCRLSGSFHTLHMAKVKGAGPDSDGFPGLLDMCFFYKHSCLTAKSNYVGKERNPENLQRERQQTCDCSSSSGVLCSQFRILWLHVWLAEGAFWHIFNNTLNVFWALLFG